VPRERGAKPADTPTAEPEEEPPHGWVGQLAQEWDKQVTDGIQRGHYGPSVCMLFKCRSSLSSVGRPSWCHVFCSIMVQRGAMELPA
jgi:hypothetical protein